MDLGQLGLEQQEPDAVWSQNVEALQAFLAVCGQWRIVGHGAGIYVSGLDYGAVKAGFEMANIEISPEVWSDLKVIEGEAKAAMNED